MIKECFINIKKHKESFFSSIIAMMMVFILINLIIFGLFNLRAYKVATKNTNQVIVYINTINEAEKKELQKELSNINGVLSLRYESKDVALKAVALELGVELSKDSNPLSDAIYIYIDDDVDLAQLRNHLESIKDISEIDLRSEAIERNRTFNKTMNTFMKVSIITVAVFGLVMMNHLSTTSVKVKEKYIKDQLDRGITPNSIKTIFFMESVISLILSYLIALFIYSKLKNFLISIMITIKSDYIYTIANREDLLYSLLILLFTIIITAFVNYVGLNKYYKKKIKCDVGYTRHKKKFSKKDKLQEERINLNDLNDETNKED